MGKKLIGMVGIVVMLFVVFGMTGCKAYDPYEDKKNPVVKSECGNFYVQLYNEDKNGIKKGNAVVLELTEIGKEKEVLAIPSQVAGKPVTQIGLSVVNGLYFRSWSIENYDYDGLGLKKIYIPYSVTNIPVRENGLMSTNAPSIVCREIVFLSEDAPEILSIRVETRVSLFGNGIIPNIIYHYSYKHSPNGGYYWLDYLTGDNPFLNPPSPAREGYSFGGWYLETECVTQWDEELPSSADESLSLYASWNKN